MLLFFFLFYNNVVYLPILKRFQIYPQINNVQMLPLVKARTFNLGVTKA